MRRFVAASYGKSHGGHVESCDEDLVSNRLCKPSTLTFTVSYIALISVHKTALLSNKDAVLNAMSDTKPKNKMLQKQTPFVMPSAARIS